MRMLTAGLLSSSEIEREIEIEAEAKANGAARYWKVANHAVERGDGGGLVPAQRLLVHWHTLVSEGVRDEQHAIKRGEPSHARALYGPPLLELDADVAAAVAIHEFLSVMMREPGGLNATTTAYLVGRAILAEINSNRMETEDWYALLKRFRHRVTGKQIIWWSKKKMDHPLFGKRLAVAMGVRLLWIMIEVCSAAPYNQDFKLAIHWSRRATRRGHGQAWVHMDEECHRIIAESHATRQYLHPRYLPMVVRPYRWTKDTEGGYVTIRTPLISSPTRDQKESYRSADLSRVYECLDAVCGQPWKINRRVMEVAAELWRDGGGLCGLPGADNKPLPEKPYDIETNRDARRKWRREAHDIMKANFQSKADRIIADTVLRVADRFADDAAIYFPHQLDFRGRAYPIPPDLNHQRSDLTRGLLLFSGACQPDVRELRIHAANMFGFDKHTHDERDRWAIDNAALIEAVANDPIGNAEAWDKADKPFQFLAACMALHDDEIAAHLPVQKDGSCNGLQHYAAMSRDYSSAVAVNVAPTDRPADVYAAVAERVLALVMEDAQDISDTDRMALAASLVPLIGRKVVKQPVMTSVYGVTMTGARDQILARLRETGLAREATYKASQYLAKQVMRALAETLGGASRMMGWLKGCAKAITEAGHLVAWTTPLGFPVVQPYRKTSSIRILTHRGSFLTVYEPPTAKPAGRKHINGIAPNVVHSLDATHMLLVARECAERRISFASVHDSYWTHSGTAEEMGVILREQFAAVYAENVADNLRREWMRKFGVDIPEPPVVGDFDVREVVRSPYFFS